MGIKVAQTHLFTWEETNMQGRQGRKSVGGGGGGTSGVKMESGTKVQKNPKLTQWVANFLMPK